ncbi:Uncharacterised protein [Bacillus freudenreichii]|nr:Uncharacterised protein [Bacillus freudenreichii]
MCGPDFRVVGKYPTASPTEQTIFMIRCSRALTANEGKFRIYRRYSKKHLENVVQLTFRGLSRLSFLPLKISEAFYSF